MNDTTRSTRRGDVKIFRTLDERPATASLHSATPKRKNVPCFFVFRGGDFLLKWKGHFSFWCSAQKFLGRCRGEENSVTAQRPLHQTVGYDSLSPLPLFRSALAFPRIHAFLFLAGFCLDFGLVAGKRGRVSSKEETDGIQCRYKEFIAFSFCQW